MLDISKLVGNFGPWQCHIFAFTFYVSILSAWNNLVMTFFAPPQSFECMAPAGALNVTQCSYRDNATGKRPCSSWRFDSSFYTSTVVEEWNLVCGREWLVSMSQSVYMAGYLTSMLVFGQLSDKFGRRPIIFLSVAILILSGFGCLLATNFGFFTVVRFFISLGVSGAGGTGFVLLMEIVGPLHRVPLGVGFNVGWATGFVLLPGLVWFLREWRHLQAALASAAVLLLIAWWVIPESPRWLITRRRLASAEATLLRAGTLNGKDLNAIRTGLSTVGDEKIEEAPTATILDLLKYPVLRGNTLKLFICWFANSFIYFGLALNTNQLGGHPLLTFLLTGALEFPAYGATWLLLRKSGRRAPQMAALGLGGLACVLTLPARDLPWAQLILAMSGKVFITASFAMLYVYSAELFPTVVRNVGVGAGSACARLASVVAPFVKELGQSTHPTVPFVAYGGLAMISVVMVYLLPETATRPLPDTIEDLEREMKTREVVVESAI